MRRMIVGTELEYGFGVSNNRIVNPLSIFFEWARRTVVSASTPDGLWLANGARLYPDQGHPEYATPECSSIRELVTAEKASERIVEEVLIAAGDNLYGPLGTRSEIFRNTIDSKGTLFGYHENYCLQEPMVNVRGYMLEIRAALTPFIVARQLLCGAGQITRGKPAQYLLSQRAPFVGKEVSATALGEYGLRPIFLARDEPLAEEGRFDRLMIVAGDANMLEWSTFLKVGLTQLLLFVLEDNPDLLHELASLRVYNIERAMRTVASDLTFTEKLPLHDRSSSGMKHMSALQILHQYLEILDRAYPKPSGEIKKLIEGFRWELQQFDDPKQPRGIEEVAPLLGPRVDWALKYQLLTRRMNRLGCDLNSSQIRSQDIRYHTVRVDQSKMYKAQRLMEQAGHDVRITSDSQIQKAMRVATQSNRARLRGEFVRRAWLNKVAVKPSWQSLSRPHEIEPCPMDDPFDARDGRVERYIERVCGPA